MKVHIFVIGNGRRNPQNRPFLGQNGAKLKVVIFGNGAAMGDPKLLFFGVKMGQNGVKSRFLILGDLGENESSYFCQWKWEKKPQNRPFLGQNGA